ncbi:alpha/beta fold hydrolase [Curvivirga aplysinae]|uniref:alpha/beta fold hydrolase n=1 Tax=Curvivirga aplysinae TaxID=2529852 RepID=UPI001C3F646D|nr:alpha/beta hydrolase [Curvivirga aplysinae]
MPFNSFASDISLILHGEANDNPTILFLHGAGMDHTVWSEQITPLINAGFHVAELDLPQHGSSKGEAASSITDMAEDVISIINASGLEDILITGHSMGALISLAVAASGNKNVSSACFCGVSSRMPVHPDLLGLAEANDIAAAKMIAKWSYGSALSDEAKEARIDTTITLVDGCADGVLGKDMNACNNFSEAQELTEKIDIPVLLLLGEEDKMTPVKGGEKLEAMLSKSHKVILPKAGHMMMQEDAEGFNKALMDFAGIE